MIDHFKEDYEALKLSGMFWEFFPEFTGNWEQDKHEFVKLESELNTQFPDRNKIEIDE